MGGTFPAGGCGEGARANVEGIPGSASAHWPAGEWEREEEARFLAAGTFRLVVGPEFSADPTLIRLWAGTWVRKARGAGGGTRSWNGLQSLRIFTEIRRWKVLGANSMGSFLYPDG